MAFERAWGIYNERVLGLLRRLFASTQTMVTGSLSGNYLILPRLTHEDPTRWEYVQIWSGGAGQPAQFRVLVAWEPGIDPPSTEWA